MARSSWPRPSFVTRLEPTLTTMRRASRSTAERGVSGILEARIDVDLRLLRDLQREHVLVDGQDEHHETNTRQHRNLEHGAFVAETLDEILHARLALFGRDHI